MRRAPWCALLCCVAVPAAAQERAVTFEEPQPVSVTGFAVGGADYARLARSNTFTAGKIAISLFKPAGDVYLFGQLTTALEGGASTTEIDNLLVSWTPQRANRWTVAFGRFDAPIGSERDSTDANQRSLVSGDLTIDRGRLILGAEVNVGREQGGGANPTWRGAALTGFVRLARNLGFSARYDQMEDSDGLLTGTPQIL